MQNVSSGCAGRPDRHRPGRPRNPCARTPRAGRRPQRRVRRPDPGTPRPPDRSASSPHRCACRSSTRRSGTSPRACSCRRARRRARRSGGRPRPAAARARRRTARRRAGGLGHLLDRHRSRVVDDRHRRQHRDRRVGRPQDEIGPPVDREAPRRIVVALGLGEPGAEPELVGVEEVRLHVDDHLAGRRRQRRRRLLGIGHGRRRDGEGAERLGAARVLVGPVARRPSWSTPPAPRAWPRRRPTSEERPPVDALAPRHLVDHVGEAPLGLADHGRARGRRVSPFDTSARSLGTDRRDPTAPSVAARRRPTCRSRPRGPPTAGRRSSGTADSSRAHRHATSSPRPRTPMDGDGSGLAPPSGVTPSA